MQAADYSGAHARALSTVHARAEGTRGGARARIAEILASCSESDATVEALVARIRDRARVTLSFHPDRRRTDGITVVEGLLRDGRYRSQFETGVTSGSPTAFAGGERNRWEEALFGGAYQQPGVSHAERPKYGALDSIHHADGGSPRFGSCYFQLRRSVMARCTLTWGDSHAGPEHVGTMDLLEPLLCALLETAATTSEVLGLSRVDVPHLLRLVAQATPEPGRGALGRALDSYIEAQVHGELDLTTDFEALVADPAFEHTAVGERLDEISSRYRIALHWHPGFVIAPHEVPADFRGPRMVPLAARVDAGFSTVRGQLDAAALGRAADALHRDPESWKDWGTREETWQHLKQLWHVLVRFGRERGA